MIQEKSTISVTHDSEAATLALRAIGWTVADPARAGRLLALTGLEVADLRDGIERPTVQAAVLGFLADHEPDLMACAAALGEPPARLMAARAVLCR
jgi:hypothetical protein